MQRQFSSPCRRRFAWLLVMLFLHAQSVMGMSMRSGGSGTRHGVQHSLVYDVNPATMRADSGENDGSSVTAPCPMNPRVKNEAGGGCSGCAACCGANISPRWLPIMRVHEFTPALLVSEPATIHTSPPFHPPKRN
jgi:hypothetical protein